MAKSLNRVEILGRLGQEPDVKDTKNGDHYCSLSIATSEFSKDHKTKEVKETVEWHRVILFGKSAEAAGTYLKKGSRVFIVGKIRTRKWQDKNKTDHFTTEILASDFILLDGIKEEATANVKNNRIDTNKKEQYDPLYSDSTF